VAIKTRQSRDIGNFGHTAHRTKTNKAQKYNTTQTTKKISNTDHTNNQWSTQVLAKGNQFLPLIRYQSCYSNSQDVLDTLIYKQTYITNMTKISPPTNNWE
jgi:hypothetical protein